MTQPQKKSANDLLMSGGIKSIGWKDHGIGYTVIGTIVDEPIAQQMTKFESTELAFWPSGQEMMEIICTLQTDLRDPADAYDDGKRRLHIPPRMQPTVREAVKRVGAEGLAIGGRLAVRRTGGTGATGSPFEFAAEYAQPVVDPGGLLAASQPATPAAAQPLSAAPAQAAPAAVQGSLMTPVSAQPAPEGVDPVKWAALGDVQRQAVLAAMAPPAHAGAGF